MPSPRPRRAPAPEVLDEDAGPFVKWVGGKRQLLGQIIPHLPDYSGRYFEPFVGGGALYFHLKPKKAVLSDGNERLVRTYRGVRDDVNGVLARLHEFPHSKEFYLQKRAERIDEAKTDAEVAAWFIYLNKTGFNGLYRVNSRNIFNVPFGAQKKPNYCDERTLRACAQVLAATEIEHEDFSVIAARARRGDLVYFDPPYVPMSVTSYFTSYTSVGFDMQDQLRLRDVALGLKHRGVHVILSNSSAPAVYELYSAGFECIPVTATRMVNPDAKGRGRVTELLIR